MNILLPIVIAAALIGLFARRLTWREYFLLFVVIVVTIVRYYIKEG